MIIFIERPSIVIIVYSVTGVQLNGRAEASRNVLKNEKIVLIFERKYLIVSIFGFSFSFNM